MKTIGKYKITADQARVAHVLGKNRVAKVSELAVGRGRRTRSLKASTPFSERANAVDVRAKPTDYKKYVVDYVRNNPRVLGVVYATNTMLLNRVLSEY